MILSDAIPGLATVSNEFREKQLEGYLGLEAPVCGIFVAPFTPRMQLELEGSGNNFLVRGEVNADDVLQFMHRILPNFSRSNRDQKTCLTKFLCTRDALVCATEITDYILKAHESRPDLGSSSESFNAASWSSVLCDLFAEQYGWAWETVLDTPWRVIWQQHQRIIERKDKTYSQKAPGDRALRQKWIAEHVGGRS